MARFATGDILHLRLSGNAPELRCYTEAGEPDLAADLCRNTLERLRFVLDGAAEVRGPAG